MSQLFITDETGRRQFVCSPAALIAFIVDPDERLLLLSHPKRPGRWEPVNGALDAGETVLNGILREAREEIGAAVLLRPLGTIHVATFHYDPHVQFMLSISYLLAYEGGDVVPGDDMAGSKIAWQPLADLADSGLTLLPPTDQPLLHRRALELYRLWQPQTIQELQRPLL